MSYREILANCLCKYKFGGSLVTVKQNLEKKPPKCCEKRCRFEKDCRKVVVIYPTERVIGWVRNKKKKVETWLQYVRHQFLVSASPGDLVMLVSRGYIDHTFQESFKVYIHELYCGSNYSSKLNRIDVVSTYPVEFVALDPPGVVRGLVYHRAEVKISSQTFVTGPEKLSRPTHIPGWRCVKANQHHPLHISW